MGVYTICEAARQTGEPCETSTKTCEASTKTCEASTKTCEADAKHPSAPCAAGYKDIGPVNFSSCDFLFMLSIYTPIYKKINKVNPWNCFEYSSHAKRTGTWNWFLCLACFRVPCMNGRNIPEHTGTPKKPGTPPRNPATPPRTPPPQKKKPGTPPKKTQNTSQKTRITSEFVCKNM